MIETQFSDVYLAGDSTPIYVDLPAPAVLFKLRDMPKAAAEAHTVADFIALPLWDGAEAYVRPEAVVAIFPARDRDAAPDADDE